MSKQEDTSQENNSDQKLAKLLINNAKDLKALENVDGLQHLEISNSKIDIEAARSLQKFLSKDVKLESLKIENCIFDKKSEALIGKITVNSGIKKLVISYHLEDTTNSMELKESTSSEEGKGLPGEVLEITQNDTLEVIGNNENNLLVIELDM